MNYDRNSFLSGIAVGRQLKGWGAPTSGGGGGGGATIFASIAYRHPFEVRISASAYAEELAESTAAAITGGTIAQHLISASVSAGLDGTISAQLSLS